LTIILIIVSAIVQRCRLNEDTGVAYVKPLELGEPVLGLSGVGMVTASRAPGFDVGDLVHAPLNWPWVELFNARTDDPLKLTLEKV